MQRRCLFTLPLFLLILSGTVFSQEVTPLFASDELLEFTLEADLVAFLDDRGGDPDYHDATLSFTDEKGNKIESEVEIKARGRTRRLEHTCGFPPIKMKFSKKKDYDPLFDGQRKIKLVTHCAEQQYILREYYLYKVYNLLSPISFKVRLVRIKYVDKNGARPEETSFAFFIEDDDDMAERMGEVSVDEGIPIEYNDLDREQTTLVHIFHYMIGNRDYRLTTPTQNTKIITHGNSRPVPVPYDFDYAGMVNAEYTKLMGEEGKPVYKERMKFKPLCRTEAEFQEALDKFRAIEDDIEEMYESSPYLDAAVVKETLKYYKTFYKTIRKSSKVQEIFVASCNE